MSSDVAADSTVNGVPEYAPNNPFTCQPPSIADAAPVIAQVPLASPNGSSATNDAWKLCGRSCGSSASFSSKYSSACTRGEPSLNVSQQIPKAFDQV